MASRSRREASTAHAVGTVTPEERAATVARPVSRLNLAAWAYFLGVMAAYMVVILKAPQPPAFVDYPDWVFQGVLLHGVLTGHPVAGYLLKPYPVPNSLTTVGLGLLDCAMPWAWAAKLWICGYLALATVVTWQLCEAADAQDWRLLVALPSVMFLNLDFWWGHISFEIGLCLLFLFAAMLLRRRSTVALGALLVLLFFTHMEACACALLLLLLATYERRDWRVLRAAVPTLLLTLWYALRRFGEGPAGAQIASPTMSQYGSPAFLLYKANSFLKPFGYVNARAADGWSQTEAMFGAGLFLVLAAGALLVAGLCFWLVLRRGSNAQTRDAFLLRRFAVSAFVLAAVLPQLLLGVADPGSRLVLAGVGLGLFGVPWRRPAGTALALCSMGVCLMNLWQFDRITGNPELPGRVSSLPAAVRTFAHVEPGARIAVYDQLRRGEMDEAIFRTGIFRVAQKRNGRPE